MKNSPIACLALLIAGPVLASDDQDWIADFRTATPIEASAMTLKGSEFALSPKGWVAVVLKEGVARAQHLASGRQLQTPAGVSVQCAVFRPQHDEVWFGLEEGGVLVGSLAEPDPAKPTAPLAPPNLEFDGSVDQIVFSSDGRQFAWRSIDTKILSVVVAVGVIHELRTVDNWVQTLRVPRADKIAFQNRKIAPFQFALGGRILVYLDHSVKGERLPGGVRPGVIYDLRKLETLETFKLYLPARARGWVLSGDEDQLVFAVRNEMSKWSLVRKFLTPKDPSPEESLPDEPPAHKEDQIIDPKARGKHFVDLFQNHQRPQAGRWMVEDDFEEEGAQLYDLTGQAQMITLGKSPNMERGSFVDFGITPSAKTVVFMDERMGGGLAVLSTEGDVLLPNQKWLAGKRVVHAATTDDGKYLVTSTYQAATEESKAQYALHAFQIAGD